MFNEETQTLLTLESQSLGLDTNKYITEPWSSLVFTLSTGQVEFEQLIQPMQSSCLKFDEFLAENIHS